MFTKRGFSKAVVALTLSTVAVLAAACSSTPAKSSPNNTTAATPTTVALPTATIPTQTVDAAIATTVPASIKSTGTLQRRPRRHLRPGRDHRPNDGTTIVGMDADLAYGHRSDSRPHAQIHQRHVRHHHPRHFSPASTTWRASSFTDTLARQKVVDFVDYFSGRGGLLHVSPERVASFNGLATRCAATPWPSRTAPPSRPTHRPSQEMHQGRQGHGQRPLLRQPEPGQPGRLQRSGPGRVRRLPGGRLHRGHLQRGVSRTVAPPSKSPPTGSPSPRATAWPPR
jgi:hypothetical protein